MRTKVVRKYGWLPDVPDHRDLYFLPPVIDLPESVDLSTPAVPVFDQLALGSCTAQAIASAHMFEQVRQKNREQFIPSRLFIYYNERVLEGTVPVDAGAYIRDGIKVVAKLGVPPETEWKYDISKFARRPPASCYLHAQNHQALKYERVPQTLPVLQACLASGHPVIFGFSVYESFESAAVAKTGMVPMPLKGERLLGGHAVKLVGYKTKQRLWKVKNSWKETWGDKGYFWMPFDYLLTPNLSDDFWKITLVE